MEKKSFENGINSDIAPRLMGEGFVLNLMNGRMAVSEYGRNGRVENAPGTTLIPQTAYPPYGNQQELGWCEDEENGRILYFMYNSHGDHAIYAFYPLTNLVYPVLYDSQVEGGLGFSKNYRIHSAFVAAGMLYWTDYINQPRRLNIDAGINLNRPGTIPDTVPYSAPPMTKDTISLIRKPPNYPLSVTKVTQGGLSNNFIALFSGKFAAFYETRFGEKAVISMYSELVRYNTSADTYNAIDVSFQLSEIIPQEVQRVNLCVQFGIDPDFFIIKTWDKNNPTDAAAINAHNAGSSALTFRVYNPQGGLPLDSAFSVKPFDSVPINSKTLETGKNRCFLANNVEGYSTPAVTSLTAELFNQSSGATLTGQVWQLELFDGSGSIFYVVYITGISVPGYYDYLAGGGFPPDPVSFLDLDFVGPSVVDVYQRYVSGWPHPGYSYQFSYTGTDVVISSGTPINLVGGTCFKSGAAYKIATVFYDRWMRKCGIKINNVLYQTADRSYASVAYTTGLIWSLSNTNAINEIPDWAEFYSVVMTKNLNSRFFIQARSKNTTNSMTYVTKDANNQYAFATSTYSATLAGIGIDITNITSFGMGYNFQAPDGLNPGDLIKIYLSTDLTTVHTLKIIAQEGRWLVCELKDLGTLNNSTLALFEIYTPYIESFNEAYYEQGAIYPINNPGTSSREYSQTSDTISGDVTILSRNATPNNYLTENMSANDTYWLNWFTNAGRPNIIDNIGQQTKKNGISWSNVYVSGGSINGLSTFDALDEKSTPQECGEIQKLQLANKIAEEGSIMLAICTHETVSLYLSEVQLVGQSANAYVAQALDVIGTIYPLKGSLGTLNPESVVEYLGVVFWIDVLNGCIAQYSSNGLENISRYGMTRFFQRYCKEYLASNNNNLDNINGFHHISMAIDPFHKQLLVTLPALIYNNYASTLPSYSSVPSYLTSIINRFDVFDFLGKTMAYKFEENKWGENWEFMAEGYCYIQNKMYGWKNGALWQFNSNTTAYNTFFGVPYPVRICTLANLNPSALKDLYNLAVESNAAPDGVVAMTTYPDIQITDLSSADFENDQSVYYAYFLRDRLSPNASGTADDKLYTGDLLTDFAIFVMLEFQQYSSLFFCQYVNIGYEISKGQKQIVTPNNQ